MRGQVVFPERLNCSRSTLSSAGQREEAFKAVYLRQMCDKCQRGFNYSLFVAKFYALKALSVQTPLFSTKFPVSYSLLSPARCQGGTGAYPQHAWIESREAPRRGFLSIKSPVDFLHVLPQLSLHRRVWNPSTSAPSQTSAQKYDF